MKKLSIICTLALVLGIMAGPVYAYEYCKDYLEEGNPGGWTESLKTFEETIDMEVGETVFIDVWINDLRPDVMGIPDTVISGGFEASWTSNLDVVNVTPYDKTNGGPWDPLMSSVNPMTNPIKVKLSNLACVGQDADGDIILAKLEIHKVGEGTGTITFTTIPGYATFASCIDFTELDPEVSPNTFTIIEEGSLTTTTTTHTGTTTSTITISSTTSTSLTTTSTASSSWEKTYNEMWGSRKGKNLSLLRTFRDEVLANSELGIDYTSMFYDNSLEILTLLIQDPSLTGETKEIIDELLPGIHSVLDGSEMTLSKRQLGDIQSLLTRFETKASPGLKTVLQKIKSDMGKGRVVFIRSTGLFSMLNIY